ncbi:MAG TPA: YidB family protein [Caldimonas sp.]|nr:YidB family protein [Caldimonas sp.]
MGLLDQILGGLTGSMQGQGQTPMGQSFGGAGGGAMMALLPIVLSMLSNRGGAASGVAGAGGGAMGGLGGLLQQLTQSGYGQQADSWVGTGANEPLPPQAWSKVLAPEQLSAIASQAGISEDEARHGLSQLVPEVVDHLTPQGQLPAADQLLASIDQFASRLGR